MNTLKKGIAWLLAVAMLLAFAGCAKTNKAASPEENKQKTETNGTSNVQTQEGSTTPAEEDVTITFFSNLTDRTNGQGLIEQQLLDMYMAEHPNVHIQLETLDDNSYQTKFKAYVTANEVPDISMLYLTPSWMDPLLDGGIFEPVDPNAIADYHFAEGSLDTATRDGKIYGLSRNTDAWVFYYNKELFKEYNVEVPTTFDELLAAGKVFKDAGIIPVAMDGADGWPDTKWITAIIGQITGSQTSSKVSKAMKNGDFSEAYWLEACELATEGAKELFDYGFETCDYGTSQNLFVNGQAAMWWMGTWEMSLKTDFELGAFTMPAVSGYDDRALLAYSGGGYGVSASSEHKDVAMDIFLYIFEPEHWSKLCWENGICMSAQDFFNYTTGNETPVQKDILDAMNKAATWTGLDYSCQGDYAMETYCWDGALAMMAGITTPQEYVDYLAAYK